jgi:lysozyme family protein
VSNQVDDVMYDPSEWEAKRNEFVHMVTSIGHEGGYVNHPDDPGGETNFGISKKEFPHLDIKNLTRDDAKEIYKKKALPPAETNYGKNEFTLKMADIGINAGPQTATEIMQKSLNSFGADLEEDGRMGIATRVAFNKVIENSENRKKLMDLIIHNQKRLYSGEKFNTKTISKEKVTAFKEGWFIRANYRGQ